MKALLAKVKKGDFTLGVIGIGRVGLPLALVFARSGVKVIGIDKDEAYVAKLKRGEKPFCEEGLEELLKIPNFTPTTDFEWGVKESGVLILCVGTPLTNGYNPDFSQLYSALSRMVKVSLAGKLVIIRSTVPPGTVDEKVIPFLEKESGLKAGEGFAVAICPERIVEGRAIEEVKELPEIIGTHDDITVAIATELFHKINPNKRISVTEPKTAELVKLFSNVYRYVNFALANEFALLAEGFGQDSREIINILNCGYPRGGVPRPGLAGGPCLTKDGYFLLSGTAYPDFILLAWRLNEFIPQYIVNKVKQRLKEKGKMMHGCKIAVLGLAFKGGIDDTRYSPSVRIAELLESETAAVAKHDPYIAGTETLEQAVTDADAVVLATNHPEFKEVCRAMHQLGKHKPGCILIDCWGDIDGEEARKYGFDYIRFGSAKG